SSCGQTTAAGRWAACRMVTQNAANARNRPNFQAIPPNASGLSGAAALAANNRERATGRAGGPSGGLRRGVPLAGMLGEMPDADPAQPGQNAAPPPQLSIAALDDDADFREFIASALEQEGHEARMFATPAELVRACEERTPDIILLDIKMGRHSGEAVLADIKSRWPRQC